LLIISHRSVQIKFVLRPNIRSQTEVWTDLEHKTELLQSLEKFMQIRSQTEVWSKTYLIGKLPDQTEVQIRTRSLRPDSET